MIKTGRIIGAAAIVFLGACSDMSPTQVVSLSDGSRGIRITCGGYFSSAGDCYDKAAYVCKNRGYTVLQVNNISPPESPFFWNAASSHEIVAKCGQ